jgi:hypothetical protein
LRLLYNTQHKIEFINGVIMDINRIKASALPAVMGIIGWTANSAVQLCSAYLKGGDNHQPITINNGGTLPSSGGATYIDARQSDFTSVAPYMISSFLAGIAFMYYAQDQQANQNVQNAQDVGVQADHGQIANNVQDVGIQADLQDVAVMQVVDPELLLTND